MKKILLSIITVLGLFGATSCSDMLETESARQAFDPALDNKTDSIFYAFGILQAMQQALDQYVITGEMRGDLTQTTEYTDKNLRQLGDFSATTANAYDSAYVYYRVINNCNYYLAHRDTTLTTGSTKVAMQEYAAVAAIRAWAYLQLGRNYAKVPFTTEPLTSISQINDTDFPELTFSELVDALAPTLLPYKDYDVPTSVKDGQTIGTTNFGVGKTLTARLCYIPVAVVLGDLYLEDGRFAEAAQCYSDYLIRTATTTNAPYSPLRTGMIYTADKAMDAPSDFNGAYTGGYQWSTIFAANPVNDIVTYIPMPVNRLRGVTTTLPQVFGYDYYANVSNVSATRMPEIQVAPSAQYLALARTTDYYYWQYSTSGVQNRYVGEMEAGDMRANAILTQGIGEDSTKVWMNKYQYGNVTLYRVSTVYLHLAEALNRLGYPDAAFAILKEGINDRIIQPTTTYITDATRQLLTTTYPFFSDANKSKFTYNATLSTNNEGIHSRGAGVTSDGNFPGRSPYKLDSIVGLKLAELATIFQTQGLTIGQTKADTINAMEDLICDEYALELAFEGTRFADLCRLARHKNRAATYGAGFGSLWLKNKLDYKNPKKDLSDPSNWYLPFK